MNSGRATRLAAIGGAIAVAATLAMLAAGTAQAQGSSRCAAPDALRLAGEKERARKDYVALLRSDPVLACAKKGLQAINAPAPDKAAREAKDLCERGDAYRQLHRNDDALTAYKSALEKNPRLSCAKHGIQEASPSGAGRTLDAIAGAVPHYLLAGGLLLALFFLVLLLGYIGPVHGWLVQRPLVGRILSPRLNLDPLSDQSDKKVADAIEARIKERLTRMREEATRPNAPSYELDFGTPREDFAELVAANGGLKSALDKASEASEQTKAVGAVLDLLYTLLPIRRLTVAGVVEPPAGPCPSATLRLESNGSLAAAATLVGPVSSAPTNLTASDYLKLADPAAVWVQYEVARAIQGAKDIGPDAAESYALVREGLDRQLAGDYPEARNFYERARKLDDTNWAAWVNLAMTEVRLGGKYEKAVEILADGFHAMRRT